jgi:DNA-binding LacI/PurR family transcriptional regulator
MRRQASWEETLIGRGRPVPPAVAGDWTVGSGYSAGQELARNDDVTAVFAANDQMALGVLHALHEHGRRIPDDVSVVGFDDMEEAAHFWPPLTTIRQSFVEVGRATVDALIDEIQSGEHHHEPMRIGTELVVRKSTAAPRSTTG